eukprot:750630-Hanusia_phi.AAC.3
MRPYSCHGDQALPSGLSRSWSMVIMSQILAGAGNSGAIGEFLDDSNWLSDERRTQPDSPGLRSENGPGPGGPGESLTSTPAYGAATGSTDS